MQFLCADKCTPSVPIFLMGKGKYIMSCGLYDIKYMSFACFAPGFCSMYYIFRLLYSAVLCICDSQPRSQGFSLFVIGKAGKGPGTGRSHDFQHPDIVGVINYNNNELESPRWPPT